jgi:hypothetical protein
MSREKTRAQIGNSAQNVPEIVWASVPGSSGRIVGATVRRRSPNDQPQRASA